MICSILQHQVHITCIMYELHQVHITIYLYKALPASKSIQSNAKSICLTNGDSLCTKSIAIPQKANGCSDNILRHILYHMMSLTYWYEFALVIAIKCE